jgi:hypothetical protein
MSKHRRTSRKSQKGGDWYNPMSWFNNTNTYAPKKTLVESATDVTKGAVSSAEGLLSSAAAASQTAWNNTTESTSKLLSTDVNVTGTSNNVPVGGKRRKNKTIKGGKGGLGLMYYATPVSNMNVVKPTYWEVYNQNGGSKRKRTQRRISQRRIKTRKNKTRRS